MNALTTSFPTTQWTSVVKAACSPDLRERHEAMVALCRGYWMPLYAFSRRLGYDRQDAEDLTQGFFTYLLERTVLDSASRELGTLRTFLLRVFQRYIGDVREREGAVKRGGRVEFVPLNFDEADELPGVSGKETPELLYDRAWAHALLRSAMHELHAFEREAGRGRAFEVLEPHLNPDAHQDASYEDAAAALGMSVEAVRQAVSRLRKKFRDCLRQRIAATLHNPTDACIDEELHALKSALRQ